MDKFILSSAMLNFIPQKFKPRLLPKTAEHSKGCHFIRGRDKRTRETNTQTDRQTGKERYGDRERVREAIDIQRDKE